MMDLADVLGFTREITLAVHSVWPKAAGPHSALADVARMTSAKCELAKIKIHLSSQLSYDCGKYMIFLTHTGELKVLKKNAPADSTENFTTHLLKEHKVRRTVVEEITVYTPYVEPSLEQLAMCVKKADRSQVEQLDERYDYME